MKSITKTSTLLAGALFLAGTLALPADSQQSPGDATAAQAGATRQLGPGDGTGNAGNGPKDGTGYGKSRGRGSSSGTCTGTGPQGRSGPASRASSGRRGGRG